MAEIVLVLTLTHVKLCSSKLTIAYLAYGYLSELFDLIPHHFGQLTLLPLNFADMLVLAMLVCD